MAQQSPTLRHSGQAKRRSGTHAVDGRGPILLQNEARGRCGGHLGWLFCTGQPAFDAFGMGSGSALPSGMTKRLSFLRLSSASGA